MPPFVALGGTLLGPHCTYFFLESYMRDMLLFALFGIIIFILHLETQDKIQNLQNDMIIVQAEMGSAICSRIAEQNT